MAILPLVGVLRRFWGRLPSAARVPVAVGAALVWWVRRRDGAGGTA